MKTELQVWTLMHNYVGPSWTNLRKYAYASETAVVVTSNTVIAAVFQIPCEQLHSNHRGLLAQ